MNRPEFLKKGDTVSIVSPAGFIDKSYIDTAKAIYESWGLRVVVGKNACNSYSVYAGTDQERITDFQEALDTKDVKAIFCSRGGYGSMRIIESLNFTAFLKNPKWIVGFSDITIFHARLNNLGYTSMHSAMPKNFPSSTEAAKESLRSQLFGEEYLFSIDYHELNRAGSVVGELIGGNLSMLYSMRGTSLDYNYEGKILFIEDLNERLYHVDRMLNSLKLGGVFKQISGLVVGGMTDMYDGAASYGLDVFEIISENVSHYTFPVCYGIPAGHFPDNQTLELGAEYALEIDEEKVSFCKTIS